MKGKKNYFRLAFFLMLGVLFLIAGCGKKEEKKVRVIKVSHVFQTNEHKHIYI